MAAARSRRLFQARRARASSAAPRRRQFDEITRGKPHELPAEERAQAGLTPETWRLEIVGDETPWALALPKTCRKDDGTALTLKDLEEIFRRRPVRCLKTMQCLLDAPASGLCSHGFWEGVALRDVLARLGRSANVRRLLHTGDFREPSHRFASSLALSEVLETPPGHLPVFLAFRLNGQPLPIERGGPVRMLVPGAYGFKSIKARWSFSSSGIPPFSNAPALPSSARPGQQLRAARPASLCHRLPPRRDLLIFAYWSDNCVKRIGRHARRIQMPRWNSSECGEAPSSSLLLSPRCSRGGGSPTLGL